MARDGGGVDSSTLEDWLARRRAESVEEVIRGSEAIVRVDISRIGSQDETKMREEKVCGCGRGIWAFDVGVPGLACLVG